MSATNQAEAIATWVTRWCPACRRYETDRFDRPRRACRTHRPPGGRP